MSAFDTAGGPAALSPLVPLTAPASPSAPTAPQPPQGAAATGSFGTLAGILLKGFGLTIVTLGIYRFWLKTNVRRWYWSNTVIDGDALEYRGTARELLIGFLVAIGVLLPLYALAAGAAYLSGLMSWSTANNVLLLLALVLAQFAIYRARRYRLTRTVWRGVTFAQDGSGWTYVGRFLIALAVTFLSLGFAMPWARAFLEGYKIRHTRFGTAEGSFAPRLKRPFVFWLILWAPALALSGQAILTVYEMGGFDTLVRVALLFAGLGPVDPEAMARLAPAAMKLAIGLGAGFAWALLLWPAYRVEEFRAFTAGTTLGPVGFASGVRKLWYYGAQIRLWLALLGLSVLIALGAFGVLMSLLSSMQDGTISLTEDYVFTGSSFAMYMLTMIGFVILRELILVQGFWRHALSTLTITGLDKTKDIIAQGQADRGIGEGFADAFEIGGF